MSTTARERPAESAPWRCRQCGATVDANFQICWRCGAGADGLPDPDFRPAVAAQPAPTTCLRCGYSLHGLHSARCPECGTPFERQPVDTPPGPGDGPTDGLKTMAVLVLVTLMPLGGGFLLFLLLLSQWRGPG